MTKPFLFNGDTCSTNASSIIRLPYKGDYEDMTSKIDSIWPKDYDIKIRINLDDLKTALESIPLKDAPCNENGTCLLCLGSGEVEYEYLYEKQYYHTDGDCPQCDGHGYMELEIPPNDNGKIPDISSLVKIVDKMFNAKRIYELIQVCEIMESNIITIAYQGHNTLFQIGYAEILMASQHHGVDNECVFELKGE